MHDTPEPEPLESEVRIYSRVFPDEFERARGPHLYARDGRRYLDFFCGAGTLAYGHNEEAPRKALIRYLEAEGVVHGLDLDTTARRRFLERFEAGILRPRGLRYRVQFPGPTGTNAIEAALKLARKQRGRRNVVAFSGGFHGLTSGALAVTSGAFFRHEAFVQRADASFLPYDGYLGPQVDALAIAERMLGDRLSGIDPPAAVVLETVQAEGGVQVASTRWLRGMAELCRRCGALLIVDDVQVGCGRTGDFFSFERAGIEPDLVVLSKALSGLGLPLSAVLIKPELDCWAPGEHTGTFRSNNLALVAATESLAHWDGGELSREVRRKGEIVGAALRALAEPLRAAHGVEARGIGLIHGLDLQRPALAEAARRDAFAHGLLLESCGPEGRVLKLLPPLNIGDDALHEGLSILAASVGRALGRG